MTTSIHDIASRIHRATKRVAASTAATVLTLTLTASAAQTAFAAGPSVPVVALPAYQVSLFAQGTTDYSHPDSIIQDGQHIFIDYQNVTAKDGSDNKSSTVVEYTLGGTVIRAFSIGGHSDGLRMSPADHVLWATSNEDGNPVLHTIDTNTGAVTAYQFSGAPHGGGYDDLMFLGGQAYVVASNPTVNAAGVNTLPALYRMTLQGNTVMLTPVLMGNATAMDTTTNSSVTLNEVDPDSLSIDTQGNLVLVNQAGTELVTLQNPCTAQQTVTRMPMGTQLDDTVWITAAQGKLYVVDGTKNATYIIRSTFKPGTIFTEMPNDSGVASSVGTVNPKTGNVTPIAIGFGHPTGMMFVPDSGPSPASAAPSTCVAQSQGQSAVTTELQASNSGTIVGNPGGAFASYQISNPTAVSFTLTVSDGAFDTTKAHAFGLNVFQNGKTLATVTAQGKGSGGGVDNSSPSVTVTADPNGGAVLIQVFDYANNTVPFTVTKS